MPPTKKATAKKLPAKSAAKKLAKSVVKKSPGQRAREGSKSAPAARPSKVAPLQPVELELRVIPLSKLRPPKKNPRTVVGDVTQLAESIRERGVLQALLVKPAAGDTFEVVAGERRYRAATIVGLPGVPCQIRPAGDDAQGLADALIENIQREDMSPVDEARGFQALIDVHGLEQQQVAERLSVSPAHVSRRLALLKLPEKAVQALADEKITIATAYELSKLADAPERIEEVLDADPDEQKWALDEELREHEYATEIAKARAALEAKGVRVIDPPQTSAVPVVGAPIRIADPADDAWFAHMKIDVKAHEKEPCHAVAIQNVQKGKPLTSKYCTDRARHDDKGESALKSTKPKKQQSTRKAAEEESAKARKKAEREAARARTAFMVGKLDGSVSSALIHELALRRYATSGWAAEAKLMVNLLGLEPILYSHSSTQKDYGGTIRKYLADGDEDTMLRAALARAFAEGEEHGRTNEHRQLLVSLGYRPAEIEQEAWNEVETALALTDLESAVIDYEDACKNLDVEPDPALRTLVDELEADPPPRASRARELEQQVRGFHASLTPPLPLDVEDGAESASAEVESSAEALTGPSSADAGVQNVLDVSELDTARLGDEFPPEILTDYAEPEPGSGLEAQCRETITLCDPAHDEVGPLQQELYRGNVQIPRADKMLSRLKTLARIAPLNAAVNA